MRIKNRFICQNLLFQIPITINVMTSKTRICNTRMIKCQNIISEGYYTRSSKNLYNFSFSSLCIQIISNLSVTREGILKIWIQGAAEECQVLMFTYTKRIVMLDCHFCLSIFVVLLNGFKILNSAFLFETVSVT